MANALSRRALLAAPLFATACAAAPAVAAPVAISDELKWMIDTYEEFAGQHKAMVAEIERITSLPDQPFAAEVLLKEVASREGDYPADWRQRIFYTEAGIDRFFAGAKHGLSILPEKHPYFARVDADRERALTLFRQRREDRARFEAESGLEALDERDTAISGKLGEIEKWLRAYTCRSLGDVIAIAAFADRWLPDDEPDIDARSDLLRAISAYATAAA